MSERTIPFPKYGSGVGLHRVTRLCRSLGVDPAAVAAQVCVVTGSNGKGGTAVMTQAILTAAGARTARFVSPHLSRLNERFSIDGGDIDDEALHRHWTKVTATVSCHLEAAPEDAPGGFEFLFLVALSWLAEERPQMAVMEAGIGGRYDPTRLLRAPRTALVSADLEHTELLGRTRTEIAYDKLDACTPGGMAVIGAVGDRLAAEIETYCRLTGVRPRFLVESRDWALTGIDPTGTDVTLAPNGLDRLDARVPLVGRVQANNAAVAGALAGDMLRAQGFAEPDIRRATVAGLAAVRWPGRLERIAERPLVVIDVGHTPDAVTQARDDLFRAYGPDRLQVLVCGCSSDKNGLSMIEQLAPCFPHIVCAAALHKGRAPQDIADIVKSTNPTAEVVVAPDMRTAWREAQRLAGGKGGIYAAGGLFLAMEFAAVVRGQDPATLDFF